MILLCYAIVIAFVSAFIGWLIGLRMGFEVGITAAQAADEDSRMVSLRSPTGGTPRTNASC